MKKTSIVALMPVLFGFFVMGFVDIVGISTSYVKQDFKLTDSWSNLLPMMVFFWFALISLPTSSLMGAIGRKRTVMASMVLAVVAMLLPFLSYNFPVVLTAFALLGISNTILQVSLNPLLMNVVSGDKVTSTLTLGQFIKAICSFLGPIIVGFAAIQLGNWKIIFPIYATITLLSLAWLAMVRIDESGNENSHSGFGSVLGLLKNKSIILYFSIILLIVGFEIGFVTTIPKYLAERCSSTLEEGGLVCSLYYAARTIGAFLGAIILAKVSSRKFLFISMLIAILSFAGVVATSDIWVINISIFILGLACANVFAIAFSLGMQQDKSHANEISALMIMGVAGGALIPPIMGLIADNASQALSLVVPFACILYIFIVSIIITKQK